MKEIDNNYMWKWNLGEIMWQELVNHEMVHCLFQMEFEKVLSDNITFPPRYNLGQRPEKDKGLESSYIPHLGTTVHISHS